MTLGVRILKTAAAVLAGVAVIGCGNSVKEKEDTYVDLAAYYGVSSEGEYGIVADGEPVGTAVTINEKIYLPQEVVYSEINSQFYYDDENNQIRYAAPTSIEVTNADDGDSVITYNGEIYLELEYVTNGSNVKQTIEEEPDRIVFFAAGELDTYNASEDTVIRQQPSESASVLTDVTAGQLLYDAETTAAYGDVEETDEDESMDGWLGVMTEKGVKGYILSDKVKSADVAVIASNTEQPSYSHISLGEKVCLGWQLMTNTSGNLEISEKISGADGLNVISPTWYSVSGTDGSITSYASWDYVDTAHNNGLQVWALVSDFETDESGNTYIQEALSKTESRTELIDNLISEASLYSLDGINIDFENISLSYAANYVQFIRELSVACRNNGIILSVDMYVPMSYNQYYNREVVGEVADYLIIMGYDEHWAGCSQAGSVASLPYVKNGIYNTLKSVDADRVINAVPFYTRIWTETAADYDDGSGVYVEDSVNGNYILTSRAVGMEAAEEDLAAGGGEKVWQEDLGQYYGTYEKGNSFVRIWLEEERSIEAKLDVMEEAGLAGVACWQLGYEKSEVWSVISEYLSK